MVDKAVIQHKINIIENNLLKLNTLAKLPADEFVDKFYYVESAKHLLQVSIEAMLDISHHIIARKRYRVPGSYAEAFVILVENNILPKDKEGSFVKMAKFRNRIVHLYHKIDDEEIYVILQGSLSDLQAFVGAVVIALL